MRILYNRLITRFRSLEGMRIFMQQPSNIFSARRLFSFPESTAFDKLSPAQKKLYLTALITSRSQSPKASLRNLYDELSLKKELVDYVQYDQTYEINYALEKESAQSRSVPTADNNAWWFQAINCEEALKPYILKNPPENLPVSIAVIDSGIDSKHPDLENRIAINQDFCNIISTNGNIVNPNGVPITGISYFGSHGTHVGGIVGAQSNSSYTTGIAHQAKLFNIRAFSGTTVTPEAMETNLSLAVHYIVNLMRNDPSMNIRVINASWGSFVNEEKNPKVGETLKAAIDAACEQGIVVVCAACNSGSSGNPIDQYVPAKFDNLITVGSFKKNGNKYIKAGNSNFGPNVIGAPGFQIKSLNASSDNNLLSLSGTSMATGFVSGLVARMIEKNPDFTNHVSGQPCNIAATILDSIIHNSNITIDQTSGGIIGQGMIDVDNTLGLP
jgi:subtilisin family serine protease